MNQFVQKLKDLTSSIEERNDELANELKVLRSQNKPPEEAPQLESNLEIFDPAAAQESFEKDFALETIVLRVGRPVLKVFENRSQLNFTDAESEFWKAKLQAADEVLSTACRSIGRIELQNHSSYSWVGTGWVVAESIIVTNRHVAEVFGRKKDGKFIFRMGLNNKAVSSSVDFLKEFDNDNTAEFEIEQILRIAEDNEPDLAFLKVKVTGGKPVPGVIKLSGTADPVDKEVAVIGYPARDSRIPEQDLMIRIFGDVFDKKRLAPGLITGMAGNQLFHDCSTLGGNSGSAVIDIATGEALGIHFAGSFLERNFAVSASAINQALNRVLNTGTANTAEQQNTTTIAAPVVQQIPADPAAASSYSFTIPVTVSVTVGQPDFSAPATIADGGQTPFIEGRVEDYSGRTGYLENFLGDEFKVPLPVISNPILDSDLLRFGNNEHILKYQHFSVVMSASRRICVYSAVNIDGSSGISMKRSGWRIDPRIPKNAQIMNECYGESPKFSRGHMTRREDPIWGTLSEATMGNQDSMHVTNTVPQMQTLNGVMWLALEDYALQNARKDKMKICVFTGPVLQAEDPMMFGVKIPVKFWKIIAFVHDETKKLSATGYLMSQESHLKKEEFVFGVHNEEQVSIKHIEKLTGLSFNLNSIDPLQVANEMPSPKLTGPEQIRFV